MDCLPSAIIFRKVGLSLRLRRIHMETPSRTREMRKGMRQAQALKASSPKWVRVTTMTTRERNRPTVAVVWIQAV